MNETWREALRVGFDSKLDAPAVDGLASSVEERRLSANEVLFTEGDAAESLFVVVEGRLQVSLHGAEGLVLRELGPGALVGEIALLAGGKRSATVSAAEPSVVLGVTQERLETLRKANPAISDALTRAL